MRSRLSVAIVSPSAVRDPLGNSITAVRWAGILAGLGHCATVLTEWEGEEADLLVALHARRSNPSVVKFRQARPGKPIVVALTGTDLYAELHTDAAVRHSLALADRIIALQDQAGAELDDELRGKLHVIYQSAVSFTPKPAPLDDCFEVCVLSHLREVKDPLRAAFAARCLPATSKIRITHAGRALEAIWAERARAEEQSNPRYRWIGEQTHHESLALLARSRALVLSSEMEGGANAVAEAVVSGIPVLCSKIPANIGMLGTHYPAYFRLRDTDGLSSLLGQIESDPQFLQELQTITEGVKDRFSPAREKEAWQNLLKQL